MLNGGGQQAKQPIHRTNKSNAIYLSHCGHSVASDTKFYFSPQWPYQTDPEKSDQLLDLAPDQSIDMRRLSFNWMKLSAKLNYERILWMLLTVPFSDMNPSTSNHQTDTFYLWAFIVDKLWRVDNGRSHTKPTNYFSNQNNRFEWINVLRGFFLHSRNGRDGARERETDKRYPINASIIDFDSVDPRSPSPRSLHLMDISRRSLSSHPFQTWRMVNETKCHFNSIIVRFGFNSTSTKHTYKQRQSREWDCRKRKTEKSISEILLTWLE